jgi:hypothetical protein
MHWWHWNEYCVAFTVKGDGFESAGQLGVCVCVCDLCGFSGTVGRNVIHMERIY